MKKILWIGIAYGALVLAQLIGSLLFSMLTISSVTKVLVLACLLLASGAMLPVSHILLKKEQLTDAQLAVVSVAYKQVTLLIAAGTFSLLAVLLELFFAKAFVVQLAAALLLAAACVIAGIRIYGAVRSGQEDGSSNEACYEDAPYDDASWPEP